MADSAMTTYQNQMQRDYLRKEYRTRAQRMRSEARWFLGVLLFVVLATASIFVFASEITGWGVARDLTGMLVSRLEGLKVKKLETDLIRRVTDAALASQSGQEGWEQDVTRAIRELQRSLDERQRDVDSLREQMSAIAMRDQDAVRQVLYSEMATRAGAVVVMLFLAQFLMSNYKYRIRLSDALDAKADALVLSQAELGQASQFASVDHVSFDSVKSPVEAAGDLAKKLRSDGD